MHLNVFRSPDLNVSNVCIARHQFQSEKVLLSKSLKQKMIFHNEIRVDPVGFLSEKTEINLSR